MKLFRCLAFKLLSKNHFDQAISLLNTADALSPNDPTIIFDTITAVSDKVLHLNSNSNTKKEKEKEQFELKSQQLSIIWKKFLEEEIPLACFSNLSYSKISKIVD